MADGPRISSVKKNFFTSLPRYGVAGFLAFLALVALCVLVSLHLGRVAYTARTLELAHSLQQDGLAELLEDQSFLAKAETLHRFAEVAFASGNRQSRAQVGRETQQLEGAVGESASALREKVRLLAGLTSEQVQSWDRLENLNAAIALQIDQCTFELKEIIRFVDTIHDQNDILNFLIDSAGAAAVAKAGAKSYGIDEKAPYLTSDQLERIEQIVHRAIQAHPESKKSLALAYANIELHYKHYIALWTEFGEEQRHCLALQNEVSTLLADLHQEAGTSIKHSISIPIAKISEILEASSQYAKISFAVTLLALAFFFFVVRYMIVVPLRWTSGALKSIQTGKEDVTLPRIRIQEIDEIATLLHDFRDHLTDLYQRADRLAGDAAGKRELEEVMRAVFMASVDGYFIWDKFGELHSASPGLLALFEVDSLGEVKKFRTELGIPSQKELDQIFDTVNRLGRFREKRTYTTMSGEVLPCELTHIHLKESGDRVLSYFRDRRLQKRTEEALLQAKNQAESAAQAKNDFLARMSHELRTPMNGVLGLTHLALSKHPDPELRGYLEKIQISANILLRVINDILDFSTLEGGNFTLSVAPFALKDTLDAVSGLITKQAKEKGLEFRVEYDEKIPAVLHGDCFRLGQSLLSLCGNAVKFTNEGFILLLVTVAERGAESVSLTFSVHDTGVGITSDRMQEIFTPFNQDGSYATRKYGGTGLGLSVTKRFVEKMGGLLHVESIPGSGSQFSFTLPFVYTQENRHQLPEQKELVTETGQKDSFAKGSATEEIKVSYANSPTQTAGSLAGKVVLLAEDNEINQEVAIGLLESFGMTVIVASNGEEAVSWVAKEPVDLVLMDIQMPVMDGLSATKLIRAFADERIRNVPIVAMTAHALQEDTEKSFSAGMNDHLIKPINVERLEQTLQRWVGRQAICLCFVLSYFF